MRAKTQTEREKFVKGETEKAEREIELYSKWFSGIRVLTSWMTFCLQEATSGE